MDDRIIASLADDDLYKFSMGNCVFINYPGVEAKYEFMCRSRENLTHLADAVAEEAEKVKDMRLSRERHMLRSLGWLSPKYIDYMEDGFSLRKNTDLKIWTEGGNLRITVSGLWHDAMMWEVKILAIVNELYFRDLCEHAGVTAEECMQEGMARLKEKLAVLQDCRGVRFADFGTRRRFSRAWHEKVVSFLADKARLQFVGTSNVRLADRYGIRPIGTMAHEYISGHLGLVPDVRLAQPKALYTWLQTYKTSLGIALSDTFTSDAFLEDFDIVLSRAFSGVRHDSGDPYDFGYKMLRHYRGLGIDPRTKTIIFSDSLDAGTIVKIWKTFAGEIGLSFGIGTNLTNDTGLKPINIVMKMTHCGGKPVCKLSDVPGKHVSGDPGILRQVAEAYNIRMEQESGKEKKT